MKLRHPRDSLTQYKDEPQPKRSVWSHITQWVYFAIVLTVIGFIVYYIAYSFYYFNQRGIILVNHIVISSARGGRILKQPIAVGEHVKKGSLLLRIDSPNICKKTLNDKKITDLKTQNSLDYIKIKMFLEQHRYKKDQLQKIRYHRSLELFSSNKIDTRSLEDSIQNLTGNIKLLRHARAIRRNAIKKLSNMTMDDASCQDEFIYAPKDGTIVAVEHKVFEVLQRTEPAMDFIADDAKVYIEAAFNNKYYNSISIGQALQIRLPTGEISQGTVHDIKSTSTPFAVQESHAYLPQRTRLLVVVAPLNQIDANRWKSFIEMEVEVRGWQ